MWMPFGLSNSFYGDLAIVFILVVVVYGVLRNIQRRPVPPSHEHDSHRQ
jgi:hypothetical protein